MNRYAAEYLKGKLSYETNPTVKELLLKGRYSQAVSRTMQAWGIPQKSPAELRTIQSSMRPRETPAKAFKLGAEETQVDLNEYKESAWSIGKKLAVVFPFIAIPYIEYTNRKMADAKVVHATIKKENFILEKNISQNNLEIRGLRAQIHKCKPSAAPSAAPSAEPPAAPLAAE